MKLRKIERVLGICQFKEPDSYADLKVGKNGHDWDGSYGA